MKNFDARRALRLAVLPAACAAALAACASYETRDTQVLSATESPIASFDRLDTNRDGFLSRAELEPMGIQSSASVDSAATALFHRLDTNGDGFLSRGEAQATFAAIPGASFDTADINRNGFLSLTEAMPHLRWLESRSRPGMLSFDTYDVNRDGFLSRAEADPLLRSTPVADGRYVAGVPMSFDRLDNNRDGFLSRAEAAPMANAVTFDQFDADRDGFLSRIEADPLLRSGVGATPGAYGGTIYGPRY
jgi:Ca2+-binding EF-hand superfamily protein